MSKRFEGKGSFGKRGEVAKGFRANSGEDARGFRAKRSDGTKDFRQDRGNKEASGRSYRIEGAKGSGARRGDEAKAFGTRRGEGSKGFRVKSSEDAKGFRAKRGGTKDFRGKNGSANGRFSRKALHDDEGDFVRRGAAASARPNDEAPVKRAKVCAYSKKCGGCAYIEMPYAESLRLKQERLSELLSPFVPLSEMVGMEDPFHYRNKCNTSFDYIYDGRRRKQVAGIYAAGTHKVVQVKGCMIEDARSSKIAQTILSMLPSFKIRVYDEDTGYGLLRHVMVRTARKTGEVMVVLVLSSPILPNKNNFVKALLEKHPEITTVVINVNDRHTSMVLGHQNIALYGNGYITDELMGMRFRISPQSFYQVNPVQTEKLYSKALQYAQLTGSERVVDAYCGIGTIGIIASKYAGEVIGVELNPQAVKDAERNAKENGVKNIIFYENDASDFLVSMASQGAKADVLIMDPPRTGSTERFMDAAEILAPDRIVYISCGPDTLARDLEYFEKIGYRAVKATGFDMFPFTEHTECVSLLVRK